MAVASGRVDRVAALVQAGLARGAGVKQLIATCRITKFRRYRERGG